MSGDNYRSLDDDGFHLEGKPRGVGRSTVVCGYYTQGHIHSFIHSVACLSTGP